MSTEEFNIRFSEDGAAAVVQKMNQIVDAAESAAQKTEVLSDQLSKVRNKALPAQAAYEKLAGSLDVLGRAQKANLISGEQEARMRTNLIAQTQAQVRPFSTLVSAIQAETRAWAASRTEREASLRTMRQMQSLQSRGVVLSNAEREALAKVNVAYVQQKDAVAASIAAERERVAAAERASREIAAAAEREAREKIASEARAERERAQIAARGAAEAVRQEQQRQRLLFNANRGLAQDRAKQAEKEERRDAIVVSVVPKINAETEALSLNTVERKANIRTIQQQEALRTAGITLTTEEVAAIQKANLAYAQQKEAISLLERTERELQAVQGRASPNGSAAASAKLAADRATLARAGAIGLINPAQQVSLERGLTAAYNDQINPLSRTATLLAERAEYQRGLFTSGRTLAQVEREVTRATEQGISVSAAEVTALRARAREVDRLDRAYSLLSKSKSFFGTFVGGFGVALGAGAVARGLDETTNIRNQIGVSANGPGNVQDITKEVYKTALATHTAVEDTARAYARIATATKAVGVGQREVLTITKALNEQIRLSGSGEGESSRASLDFVHAISSGNVQYRELRALSTQAHFVVLEIAQGLTKLAQEDTKQGKAFAARARAAGVNPDNIGVGNIKELTSHHAITSSDLRSAVLNEADNTQKTFDKLTPTIRQSLTDLNTQFLLFLDNLNRGTGVAGNVARSIEFIGKHLDTIIAVGTIAGSVLVGLFIKEKVEEFGAAISVVGRNFLGIKTGIDSNSASMLTNNTELEVNTGLQRANVIGIDSATLALARNTLARRENALALATGGVGGVGGAIPFGRRPNASLGLSAGVAEGAIATEGVAAAGAAEAGAIGLGGIVAGATAAIPLIFALGAAWLLLKDNIKVSGDQIIAFDRDGQSTVAKGALTIGDVVGGVFDAIGKKSDDTSSKLQTNSDNTSQAVQKAEQEKLDAAKNAFAKTGNAYDQLHSDLLRGIVSLTSDFLIGADAIGIGFKNVFQDIAIYAANSFNSIANSLGEFYNKNLVPKINAISAATGGKVGKAIGISEVALSKAGSVIAGAIVPGAGSEIFDATVGRSLESHAKTLIETGRAETVNTNRKVLSDSQLKNTIEGLRQTNLQQLKDDINGKFSKNGIANSILSAAGNRLTPRGSSLTSGAGEDDDPKNKAKKAKKDPLDNEFDALVKKLLPAVEAIREFNKQLDILAKADKKGLVAQTVNAINEYDKKHPELQIGQTSHDEFINRAKAVAQRDLEDKINPSGVFARDQRNERANLAAGGGDPYQRSIANKITAEEEKEAKALGLTIDEFKEKHVVMVQSITDEVKLTAAQEQASKVQETLRAENQSRSLQLSQLGEVPQLIQAQNEAYAIYKDQILAGVAGSKEAYEQRVKDNISFIAFTDNVKKTQAAYEAIISPAKEYQDTVVNLNNLLGQGLISLEKYNQELRDGTSRALSQNKDALSGFQRGILDIKKESEDIASDMENTFKDAYNNVQSGFSALFTGGSLKDSLHKVFEGLTNDLSKALFHKLTDPLVGSIGKKFGIEGFGDKAVTAQRADITATTVYVNGQPALNSNPFGNNSVPNYLAPTASPGVNSTGTLGLDQTLSNFGVQFLNPTQGFLTGGYDPLTLTKGANDNGLSGLFSSGKDFLGSSLLGGVPTPAGGAGSGKGLFDLLGGELKKGLGGLGSLLGGAGGGAGGAGGIMSLLGMGGSAGAAAGGAGGFLSTLLQFAPLFGFAGGGSFDVGGSGGTDSQLVTFKATPGENVEVKTPGQQANAKGGGEQPAMNPKIVNVMDPRAAVDAMSTEAGYKAVLNHILSNPEAIKRALG